MGMHRQKADEAYVIGKRGQYTPVAAYLAGDEIIKIALAHGELIFVIRIFSSTHPGSPLSFNQSQWHYMYTCGRLCERAFS